MTLKKNREAYLFICYYNRFFPEFEELIGTWDANINSTGVTWNNGTNEGRHDTLIVYSNRFIFTYVFGHPVHAKLVYANHGWYVATTTTDNFLHVELWIKMNESENLDIKLKWKGMENRSGKLHGVGYRHGEDRKDGKDNEV